MFDRLKNRRTVGDRTAGDRVVDDPAVGQGTRGSSRAVDDPAAREGTRASSVGHGARVGASALLSTLATLIDLIVAGVAIVIVLGIVLVVLKANMSNGLVDAIHDAAKFLAGPFDGIFTPKNHRLEIAINWGIAVVVYVIVGRFVASFLRRGRPL